MKIERFNEAYKYGYRGKGLKSNRKQVLEEIIDVFSEGDLLGFEISGTEYHPNEETLYITMSKMINDEYEECCLKLDLSGMGIEIGKKPWNEETEEPEDFIPEINLDSENVRTALNIKKYNV